MTLTRSTRLPHTLSMSPWRAAGCACLTHVHLTTHPLRTYSAVHARTSWLTVRSVGLHKTLSSQMSLGTKCSKEGGEEGTLTIHLILLPGMSCTSWFGSKAGLEQEIPHLHHSGWGGRGAGQYDGKAGGGRHNRKKYHHRPPASCHPLPVWPHRKREGGMVPALPVCLQGWEPRQRDP